MKSKPCRLVIATILALSAALCQAAGFRLHTVTDPGNRDITVGVWYPSTAPVPIEANTEFGLPVALNAPIENVNGGLIVISHGFGGWYAGHADTAAALADAGFVVAAPSHTGNTWSDMSASIDLWTLDRPRHVSRVIDHVLADAQFKAHIDPVMIGVYGFSAGGYTALGLIGAVPDLDHAARHCEQHPDEFVCAERMIDAMRDAGMHELPADAWGADRRVKAAAIAAPGLGLAYTRASLANVSADVQLWSGALDTRVPTISNAATLARRLPRAPETHWVENANHFAFMIVACREAFKRQDPVEYEMVCGDADGFDRLAFHGQMHEEMIRFFKQSLGVR